MAGDSPNPWPPTEIRSQVRLVDLSELRRYLDALGRVAAYAAETDDLGELLAGAKMIREDGPRGLRRLGVRL